MGMTAANDWTKELATKGYPDLKKVWGNLGKPDNLLATFNTHWAHNYNHVSRSTMYGFMSKHFNLGFKEPVLEREFVVPTTEEITVWTDAHPKPTGDKVGGAHEKTLLKHWSDDSDRLIAGRKDVLARAWQMMIGRAMPAKGEVRLETGAREDGTGYTSVKGTVHDPKHNEDVAYVRLQPKAEKGSGTVAVWLTQRGPDGLFADGKRLSAAAQKLIDAGVTIVCPTLYLPDAKEQPMNPVASKDTTRNEWRWAACYTYGYNPSLVVHRVHDAMNVVAALMQDATSKPAKIILVGSDGAGAVAAAAAAAMKDTLAGAVIDTEGFRFASVEDQWHPMFVPGAVKYGDVPALLSLCAPLAPKVLGENGAKGGTDAVAAAVTSMMASGSSQ
jgi:hypothetical protein